MAGSGTRKTEIVREFRGEHRTRPELLLPPNVSPDALNMDYVDGTLRKRKGFVRLHDESARRGGISYVPGDVTPAPSIPANAAYDFADDFTIELVAMPHFDAAPSSGALGAVVSLDAGPAGFDLRIFWNAGFAEWNWILSVYTDAAPFIHTVKHSGASGTAVASDKVQVISVGKSGNTIFLTVDGVTETSSTAGAYDGTSTEDITVASAVTIPIAPWYMIVDELRFWDGASQVDIQTFIRELTADEISTHVGGGDLVGYFQFNESTGAVFADQGSASNDGALNDGRWARGLIFGSEVTGDILGIFPVPVSGEVGELLAATETDIWRWDGTDLTQLISVTVPGDQRWSSSMFRNKRILVNSAARNLKYDPVNGIGVLTPSIPDASGTTATQAAGTGLTGVRKYRFRFVDSTDFAVGASSIDEVASPNVSNKSIDVNDIPEIIEERVDQVQILATHMDGAVYYHHSYVAMGTATIEDTTLDVALVTEEDVFVGKAAPSLFAVTHGEMVFLGNQDGEESRLVHTEIGTYYTHYAQNFIDLGRGDGDELTGAISVQGILLAMKRYSLWAVMGDGPSSLSTKKLYDGEGCVNHETIASSLQAVYYMTPSGIARLPLPLGSAPPQDITDSGQREFFEGMKESERRLASGVWDAVRRQYLVSFPSNSERVTLVFSEETGAWSKWDIAAGSFATSTMSGEEPKLLIGWQGYITEMHNGDNDGVDVDGVALEAVTGSVTGSGDTTLTDTGASFPTAGSGLSGIQVQAVATDGTTQERTIIYNSGIVLTIDSAWDVNPSVSDTYYIGGIDANWRTPKWSLVGDPGLEVRLERLRTWFKTDGNAINVNCAYVMDSDSSQNATLLSSTRFNELLLAAKGRELIVTFSNDKPNQPFEIEAFQAMYQEVRE